ncbi:MAG: GFA family protein [Inquilinus sp.]|nr:GFA family protein [Inquilinus sp.]
MSAERAAGGCLCGAVRYAVDGPLRPVIACHCGQCRRWSGHLVAATAAPRSALTVDGNEALAWYESSPGIRRGFCRTCGSSLFWGDEAAPTISIMAGTLDAPSGLTTERHIFAADKGDYYDIADSLPRQDGDRERGGDR